VVAFRSRLRELGRALLCHCNRIDWRRHVCKEMNAGVAGGMSPPYLAVAHFVPPVDVLTGKKTERANDSKKQGVYRSP
jgi:hypothetical protein